MTPPLINQLHSMFTAMGFTDLPDAPQATAPASVEHVDLEARCVLVALYDAITAHLLDGDAAQAAEAMSFVITTEALADTRRHSMLCTFVHMLCDLVRNRTRAEGFSMDPVSVDRQPLAPLGLLPSLRTPGSGRAFQQALDRLYVTASVSRINRGKTIDTQPLVRDTLEHALQFIQEP